MTEPISPPAHPIPQPVTLTHPIPYGAGTLDRLTFARPKAGALTGLKLLALAEMDVDTILAVIARSAEQAVSPEQLRAVHAGDLTKLIEVAATVITSSHDDHASDGPLRLSVPVPLPDGTMVEELVLRQPCAGDMRGCRLAGLAEMDVDLVLTLAERCSTRHLPPGALRQLDPADLLRVGTAVSGFFVA